VSAATTQRILAVALAPGLDGSHGPNGPGWEAVPEIEVPLEPTQLAAQPSAYVQAAWADRRHGVTPAVRVAATLAGGVLRVRLRWQAIDPRPAITDNNVYADGCALLFPLDGREARLETMGDPMHPVQAWHWRAGTAVPFVVTATGVGTTVRQATPHCVSAEASWNAGGWNVVFSRALDDAGVPLQASAVPVGIAIWQGAAQERAGLASHTPAWLELQLPAGRR
jgi:DMSO reductase family type II enzyme heme b subunit